MFQYYFYKAKFNECEYYYEGFEKYFKQKREEIEKWNNDKTDIIDELNRINNHEQSKLNNRRTEYISSLKKIEKNSKYFNELLMMYQFNKSWIDNYYDIIKK